MCHPAVMYIAMAASAGMQVKGQQDQAAYTRGMARYNKAVNVNKGIKVANKATDAQNAERQKAAQLIAKQRTALAAQGVDVDFGTAGNLQNDATVVSNMNVMKIRSNADDQIGALENANIIGDSQAENASNQANLSSVGTIMSTAGSIAGQASTPKVDPKWYGNSYDGTDSMAYIR